MEADVSARLTDDERRLPARVFVDEPVEEPIQAGELEDVAFTPLHEEDEASRGPWGPKTFKEYSGIPVRADISIKQVKKIMDEMRRYGKIPLRRGFSVYSEDNKEANLQWLAQNYPFILQQVMDYYNGLPGDTWRREMSGSVIDQAILAYHRQPSQPAVSNVARQAEEVLQPVEPQQLQQPQILEEPQVLEEPQILEEPIVEEEDKVPQMWGGGRIRRKK